MKAHATLPVVAAALLAASAAAAQDTIRIREKDGKIAEKTGEVVTLTHKVVEYEQDLGGTRAKLQEDARNVVELVPDQNGRTFDYIQAEQSFNNGDWDPAIERFERVRRDARARDILKQIAAISIVKAQWGKGNAAATVAAARALRQERGDSFFIRESFELEIVAHLSKNDIAAAEATIGAFEEKGKADGMADWAKSAEIKRARLRELQGNHRAALAIHRKYARDRDVGDEATLGELRCLEKVPDWSALNARAEAIISEARGKKVYDNRMLTGAFNGRAAAALNAGRPLDALFDYLQGAFVLNKSGEGSLEHEASLAGGALACAKVAAGEKEKGKKDTYKNRAQELLAELDKFYPGSKLRKEAVDALKEIK